MEKALDRAALQKALEIYENKMLSAVSEDHAFEPSENFEKRINRLIKSRSNVYYKFTLTKARRVIAVAAAVAVLIASLMSVSAVRERILGFFVSHESDYDVISYDNSAQEYAPDTIESAFTLAEADYPEGYTFGAYEAENDMVTLELVNGDEFITVEQFTKENYASAADKDFDAAKAVSFEGGKYVVSSMDEAVKLIWERDGYVFEAVGSSLPREEMLKLASKISIESD